MSEPEIIMPAEQGEGMPVVRKIGITDIKQALMSGFDDFWAMPTHVVFLGLIYPVIGLLMAFTVFGLDLVSLLYPLSAGLALVGPFAAIGLYELSRRREMGLDTSWRHAFDVVHSPSFPAIIMLGLVLCLLFVLWIWAAHAIYAANFGNRRFRSLLEFASTVSSSREGFNLIIVGNLVGAVFAVVAFAMSVVSFPLLLDRHARLAVAVATSLKAVVVNPIPMACWAANIAAGLVIGSLPFLVGLAIVMPVLGHASWHLYRTVIEPPSGTRPTYHPKEEGQHYAAEFPASLFTRSRDRRR